MYRMIQQHTVQKSILKIIYYAFSLTHVALQRDTDKIDVIEQSMALHIANVLTTSFMTNL